MPSGSPLIQEFKAKEPLNSVRLWISLNRTDGVPSDAQFKMSTTFPKKIFSEEDLEKPLDSLGNYKMNVLNSPNYFDFLINFYNS